MIRGKTLAAVLATAIAVAACGACSKGRAGEADPKGKPVKARVVQVESRQVRRSIESVGSLFPAEEVTVSAEVEGRVTRVFVDVGDRVTRDRPLVEVSPLELSLAADQEKAALQQTRARLGLPDGKDDLAVDDAAEVKRAAAERTDAEQKYLRAKALLEEGLISRGDYDQAKARFDSSRAAHDMARQSVEDLRAQIAQRQAGLAVARKKLSDAVIRAPFAGQVKERLVTTGQYLKVQTPVMVIVNNDPLRVRLKVPEKMAAAVAVGQPVTVRVEAFPDRTFEGTLARINPSVDPQTRSFEVEALLANPDGLLKPGFFAKASIESSRVDTALVVPGDALHYRYGVYKVFTVAAQALKETEVKPGERDGADVEITEGLTDRDAVALPLEGQEPRDGAPVEAVN